MTAPLPPVVPPPIWPLSALAGGRAVVTGGTLPDPMDVEAAHRLRVAIESCRMAWPQRPLGPDGVELLYEGGLAPVLAHPKLRRAWRRAIPAFPPLATADVRRLRPATFQTVVLRLLEASGGYGEAIDRLLDQASARQLRTLPPDMAERLCFGSNAATRALAPRWIAGWPRQRDTRPLDIVRWARTVSRVARALAARSVGVVGARFRPQP